MIPNTTALAVDTETTGLDPATAEIIEVGISSRAAASWQITAVRLYRPLGPIPPEAAAVNDITETMVADESVFSAATAPVDLINHTGYFVSHNTTFDRRLLSRYLGDDDTDSVGNPERWICTLRLARHLLPGLPRYSLQFLRHHLGLDLPREVTPHRAGPDSLINGCLLTALEEIAVAEGRIDPTSGDTLAQLAALAHSPIPVTAWPVGKVHKGKALADIPLDYLEWAISNMDMLNETRPDFDPDLTEAVAYEMIRRGEATELELTR